MNINITGHKHWKVTVQTTRADDMGADHINEHKGRLQKKQDQVTLGGGGALKKFSKIKWPKGRGNFETSVMIWTNLEKTPSQCYTSNI